MVTIRKTNNKKMQPRDALDGEWSVVSGAASSTTARVTTMPPGNFFSGNFLSTIMSRVGILGSENVPNHES